MDTRLRINIWIFILFCIVMACIVGFTEKYAHCKISLEGEWTPGGCVSIYEDM